MNWYALYTKPRNEKKVAQLLQSLGVETYCPVVTTTKQWSDRKKKVTTPVLPSYVFVQVEEKNREVVFQVPGVVRYVYWLGKAAIIRDAEITTLKEYLSEEYTTIFQTSIQPGDRIKLTTGPFKGQDALVKKISNTKTQVILESLGILLTLEK
jgi:transcriptional antiterminator RfaH